MLVFCETHGQIKYVLSLATNSTQPITIVVLGSDDLTKFFQVLSSSTSTKLNVTQINPCPNLRRTSTATWASKLLHLLPDITKERHYLSSIWKNNFSTVTGEDIVFLSRGFSGARYNLLKKLNKKNRLTYVVPKGPPAMVNYRAASTPDKVNLLIFKLTYGLGITLGQVPLVTKGFPWIPDKFIREVNRVVSVEEQDKLTKNFNLSLFKIFPTGNYRVLYYDDNCIEAGYILDNVTYKKELSRIFNVVSKYFDKKDIAFKYHPGYTGDPDLISIGSMLPAYIPAELLFSKSIKVHLSVLSWSLSHVEEGLAISIANLVSFKSNKVKRHLQEALIEASQTRVLFPESLEEFEQIITEVSKGVELESRRT